MTSTRQTFKLSPAFSFVLPALGISLLAPALTFARDGANTGGGGDAATEMRIDEIRSDILKWIDDGGDAGLKLPSGFTPTDYHARMLSVLQKHTVVIGTVTESEESATNDSELKVQVDGQLKTCRGFVSVKDRLPHILCNTERFAATAEAAQYSLIHHEYAGLAGVEQNVGASSDYGISSQITGFLELQTVLRLAVKPILKTIPVKCGSKCKIDDLVGQYHLVSKGDEHYASCTQELSIKTFYDDTLSLADVNNVSYWVNQKGDPTEFYDGFRRHHTEWNWIESNGNKVLLMVKERVGSALFGETSYFQSQLVPTSDGSVQLIEYLQNPEQRNKYALVKNCLYERHSLTAK